MAGGRLHSFDFAFGWALCVGRQRQMCAMCGGLEFYFFVRWRCFNFLEGLARVSENGSGLCRITAKLSTEFWSSESLFGSQSLVVWRSAR